MAKFVARNARRQERKKNNRSKPQTLGRPPTQTKGNEVKLPSSSRKAAVTFTIALGSNTKYGHLMKAARIIYLNERAKMTFDADVPLQEV